MLKIRAIKIEINTSDGLYGADFNFSSGLNIIRGDNSSGKSSLFQSILYGLGFEELLGGKNEKTMQSVLKDQIEYPKDQFHNVIQSFVYLEFENKNIVTTKRSVVHQSRKSQLIDVYYGALLTGENQQLESRPMYVHDAGGASDEVYGFHLFLCEFLEWNLPEVISSKGEFNKLYLQQVAPAFIVEQKSGWSDFFATLPYFGMRNTEQRVIEFLLNLNVFENERKKQELSIEKQDLANQWSMLLGKLHTLAEKTGGKLSGLENRPSIVNNSGQVYITLTRGEQPISLKDALRVDRDELFALESIETETVGRNVSKNEGRLRDLTEQLNQVSLNYELLAPELNFDKQKLRQYEQQKLVVLEDIKKNKGALKINKLGAELPTEISKNTCPTCEQEVKDSLLPTDIRQIPMRIEDNILFLDAQERMITVYIEGQEKVILDKQAKLNDYISNSNTIRQQIRDIKKELIQDERLPSVIDIEKRIDIKRKVDFFTKTLDTFDKHIDELKLLSVEWAKMLGKESGLPKDFLSSDDRRKLLSLQNNFVQFLRTFNYQSKPFEAIKISPDTYLPVAQKLVGENLFYNIKFDSSASDFIRCIWAYVTALLKTGIEFDTNHPRLLILDEPKQQDISINNFKSFLIEIAKFKNQQILVFASFENSDISFDETTSGIQFTLNKISGKLVAPAT